MSEFGPEDLSGERRVNSFTSNRRFERMFPRAGINGPRADWRLTPEERIDFVTETAFINDIDNKDGILIAKGARQPDGNIQWVRRSVEKNIP